MNWSVSGGGGGGAWMRNNDHLYAPGVRLSNISPFSRRARKKENAPRISHDGNNSCAGLPVIRTAVPSSECYFRRCRQRRLHSPECVRGRACVHEPGIDIQDISILAAVAHQQSKEERKEKEKGETKNTKERKQ